MRIPFDIKYRDKIESGEYKVETLDGGPARIICWDSTINKERPIIAIVFDYQIEQYNADGRYDNDYDTSNYDLFIVTPEPELSKFEQEVYKMTTNKVHFKEEANKLLDLAKQQLLQSGELLTQEHHEKLMETQYKETLDGVKKNWHDYFTPQAVTDIYNAGRNDILKDMPRWNKGSIEGDRIVGLSLYHNMKWILFSDLEKLPGFNDEDHE